MSTVMAPVQSVVWPASLVTIADIPTRALNLDISHAVTQLKGSASVTLPLPLPGHLAGMLAGLNVPIEIKAGFTHESLMTRFIGTIQAKSLTFDIGDQSCTFRAIGQAHRLDWPEERDLWFNGPIALHDIARSLCAWRGMERYRVDNITDLAGTTIMLGGNPDIDGGKVKIPRRTSPLSWLNRKCELFGYQVFDAPSEFRIMRIVGTPTTAPAVSFEQGVNVHGWQWSHDLEPMANYIRVDGPTYTDADGIEIPIISFPDPVPYEQLLDPPGYRSVLESDSDLVTQQLADAVRAAQEINQGSPYSVGTIDTYGHNTLMPGDVVRAISPGVEADGLYWVMGIREYVSDSPTEYGATITAWASSGTALPGGDDLETIVVWEAPVHLGDEHLAWYAQPSPTNKTFTIPITIPDEYTSIAISVFAHGCNSYLLSGVNADSRVSVIEVWQNGEKVGSAELPVLPEDYGLQLPYTNIAHWKKIRMPVPGRLEAGAAEIRIISGEDSRLPWSTKFDDFELANIMIELRGRVFPALPTGGA